MSDKDEGFEEDDNWDILSEENEDDFEYQDDGDYQFVMEEYDENEFQNNIQYQPMYVGEMEEEQPDFEIWNDFENDDPEPNADWKGDQGYSDDGMDNLIFD